MASEPKSRTRLPTTRLVRGRAVLRRGRREPIPSQGSGGLQAVIFPAVTHSPRTPEPEASVPELQLRSEALDVCVSRGPLVESRHRVHAAVVSADGVLLHGFRDEQLVTWWRSCAKPFQVLPFVREDGLAQLGWGDEELALSCASHGGEPEHVAIASAMLSRIGLEEGDLACGAHEPLTARGARLALESGRPLSRLHNNCSGKHAAMLARATLASWSTAGYERNDHPVQQGALAAVAEWARVHAHDVPLAVDGCGVTVFALPLYRMALAYARLVLAATRGDDAPARIVGAMTAHPFLVAGTDRFDTLVMDACKGRVLCKIGAEGVHTLALTDRGIGIAVKVEDGAPRAQYLPVLALLMQLGALPNPVPVSLREFASRVVRNTRGAVVGAVRLGGEMTGAIA